MTDPMAAAITGLNDERDQLRSENARLERALVAAYTDVEVLKAARDALAEACEARRVEGRAQAVREIRDHFEKIGDGHVAVVIDQVWGKELAS